MVVREIKRLYTHTVQHDTNEQHERNVLYELYVLYMSMSSEKTIFTKRNFFGKRGMKRMKCFLIWNYSKSFTEFKLRNF